jgi:hypothetical protein
MKGSQSNTGALAALRKLVEPLRLALDDAGGSVEIFGADPLFPTWCD